MKGMCKIRKPVSLFLVALFVCYYAGITFFSHAHFISGATIVHSHVHPDSHHDTKSGGHTTQSITFIAKLSHFDTVDCSYDYLPDLSQLSMKRNVIVAKNPRITSIYLKNLSLRAPPVV